MQDSSLLPLALLCFHWQGKQKGVKWTQGAFKCLLSLLVSCQNTQTASYWEWLSICIGALTLSIHHHDNFKKKYKQSIKESLFLNSRLLLKCLCQPVLVQQLHLICLKRDELLNCFYSCCFPVLSNIMTECFLELLLWKKINFLFDTA